MVKNKNSINSKNDLTGSTPSLPIGLDDKRYLRIGEVSQITGVKPYVLRYWESEFRWMAPAKSKSKQRLYRKRDIERILLIRRLLHEERYTIAGAKKRLKEIGADGIEAALSQPLVEKDDQDSAEARMNRGLGENLGRELKHVHSALVAIRGLLGQGFKGDR